MDNVTHALAGMLVAEVVVQHRGGREALPAGWSAWAYAVSALANNVPDIDIVYVGITAGKIGYLAHHRGHTHTLVGALPLGALVWLGAWLRHRRRGVWERDDRRWLAALAGIGVVLHLIMDGTNNYGVHPFWPLDKRWFYGDTIFIVEPFLWASVAPVLAFAVRPRAGKVVLGLIAAVGVALSWATGMVPPALAAVVTGWTLLLTGAGYRLEARRRVGAAVGAVLVTYAVFSSAGARARQIVADAGPPVDAAMAPFPANPACWSVTSVHREGEDLVLRRGTVSPFAAAPPEDFCPEASEAPTAPLERVDRRRPDGLSIHWEGRLPATEVTGLFDDCRGAAFLRWARIPYRVEHEGRPVAGDLRYDMDRSLGWAEIELEGPCPRWVPDWEPPRQDLVAP